MKTDVQTVEPIVHYNGPIDTLDQLTEEHYRWIVTGTDHPLNNWPRSIVFRKPHLKGTRQGNIHKQIATKNNPNGTFYIRAYNIRATIELNNEIFTGSYVPNQRCGKHGSQTSINEIYLLDIDQLSTAKLTIYGQPKHRLGHLIPQLNCYPELFLGSELFHVPMEPTEKSIKRIPLNHSGTEQYQVLIECGTFISSRIMTWIDHKRIYQGYITVYTRGKSIPKWTRYWATLYADHMNLYDFEYKESKRAVSKLPLTSALDIFHPPIDDDEQLVDVGSLGLALQFSLDALDACDPSDCEFRMYLLPDDVSHSQEWEEALLYAISLVQEFKPLKHSLNSLLPPSIPSKYIW
ncbi:hypothetical protein BDB01DRAFT_730105 [Pilobolus umbonatus]|nr:hypothetical protein BDB01DRAFT_730105 [Pilobolus umbonatus]